MNDVSQGEIISNLEILNLIFENRLSDSDLYVLLKTLQEQDGDDLIRWTTHLLRRLSAIIEINQRLSASITLNELLPILLEIVTSSLDTESATLFLLDRQTDELFSRATDGHDIAEVRLSKTDGIVGATYTSGKGLVINDPYGDDRFNPEIDSKTGFATRNILCSPIVKRDGEVIGVTQVLNKRDRPFNGDDMSMLELLTRQAAAALDHAHLFEQVERARQDEVRLLEVTSAISSELQLDTLLTKIVKVTTDFLEADRSTLFLHDVRTNELWSRVAEGAAEIRVPSDAGIVGACFTARDTVHIPDAYADPRFNQAVDKKTGYRTRNILCVPIVNRNSEIVGVMQVLNKKSGAFSHHDTRRLKAFSAQAAIALENARLFEETLNIKNYNEAILKSLTNGVVTLDIEMNVNKINEAGARIIHRTEEQAFGQSLSDLFGGKNLWLVNSVRKVTETGEIDNNFDVDLIISDKETISINMSVIPLVDLKDETIGSMLVFEDISAEKRVKATMARYMTKDVAEKLIEGGESALGGAAQEATILFTDIRSFTTISEKLGARETVLMLNEYFTDMVEVIFQYHGILDKFIGDAIMAVFGAPFSTPLDANNAVTAANQMLVALRDLNARRARGGKDPIHIGVGINTGEVIAGNIGSPKRMDYTVIGDTVNLAARLEGANKSYKSQVLISEYTRGGLTDDKMIRELDLIRVKGKEKPAAVFECLDFHTEETFPNAREVIELFEEGLYNYREQNWDFAMRNFEAAMKAHPGDYPSQLYIQRCQALSENPPSPEWDGVYTMTTK